MKNFKYLILGFAAVFLIHFSVESTVAAGNAEGYSDEVETSDMLEDIEILIEDNQEDQHPEEEVKTEDSEIDKETEELEDNQPNELEEDDNEQNKEPEDNLEEFNDASKSKASMKIMSDDQSTFKLGDSHPTISELKVKLNHIGFSGIQVTDHFRDFTEQRVREFQSYYGLSVNGEFDKLTIEKLNEVYNSPFQLGQSHNDTKEIKRKLNQLGFGGILITSFYGEYTERQVKAFQRAYGLTVNGIVDEVTLNRLNTEAAKTNFKVGDRHPNISNIKKQLNRVGFSGILVTDYYGQYTANRVKDFQRYYGLTVNGRTDTATIQKLDDVYNSPFQLGKSHSDTREIKRKLNQLGFGGILVTPLYGEYTERQVKAFQRAYGLTVNGIVDEVTLNRLNTEAAKTNFKVGDRHPNISNIKKQLNRVGFSGILVTDYYGQYTADRVKDFQRYYGLIVNGRTDTATIQKLDEVYNSPFQQGKHHDDIREIKEKLNTLGYGNIQVTRFFGSYMERQVRAFQATEGLVVNGIVDSITLDKLGSAYEKHNQYVTYSDYDITLTQALKIQMAIKNPPPQTDRYRSQPAFVSGLYVEEIELAKIYDRARVNIRTAPNLNSSSRKDTLDPGTSLIVLGTVQGDVFANSTEWYKIEYKGEELYAHSTVIDIIGTTHRTTENLNVRSAPTTSSHIYGGYAKGSTITVLNKRSDNWYEISFPGWRNATSADTLTYLDPNKNSELQHLDLSYHMGLTASELNKLLKGKGILEGKGAAFAEASKNQNINELYLISHALLETGDGTSKLARGIRVQGTTVYNMFGIGAGDSDPNGLGSRRAYNEGWDTPEKAIIGGARFIDRNYINGDYQQNTLYKMRWNPRYMAEKGSYYNQYATDIGWAVKQTTRLRVIEKMVEELDGHELRFDIVRYK